MYNLPLPRYMKLNVTMLMYKIQTISSHKPNALFEVINKYQAEECKSYNI